MDPTTIDTSGLPLEITETLTGLDSRLNLIEEIVKPMLGTPITELTAKLTPLDQAKFNIAMAYTLNALFYMYLRVQGVNPVSHPVSAEMERVKTYLTKLKELDPNREPEKRTPIDKGAANRFVSAGLSSPIATIRLLSEEQAKKSKTETSKEAQPKEESKKPKKKRKRDSITLAETESLSETEKRKTKKHKSEENNEEIQQSKQSSGSETSTTPEKKKKKEKKEKKRSNKSAESQVSPTPTEKQRSAESQVSPALEKKREKKKEKRKREGGNEEEKKHKKEKKSKG